jgi:tight adherence protein B
MSSFVSSKFLLFFIIATFVATVLLFEGLFILWNSYRGPEAKKIEQRLRALSASSDSSIRSSVLKNRMLSEVPFLERALLSIPRIHQLDRFIVQSGLEWNVSTLLLMVLIFGATGFATLEHFSHTAAAVFNLAIALAIASLPLFYVQWKRHDRLQKIVRQLPDALDLMARALRAGHSFAAALKMIGDEMNDPIGNEFRITHDEINFGVSLQQAMTNLGERTPATDLRYLVIAVLIQRETGGNLTEVLVNLSNLLRNRMKLQAKIKVLTAEGKISAWTLSLLPFGLALLLNWGNPEFINVLWTDPAGIKITQVMLTIMAFGIFWLWRITKVRV